MEQLSHTRIQIGSRPPLYTLSHLTLSGGVWKTAPHTGLHVDYHFNGLARSKCSFFGAEIIYCSYQSRTKGKAFTYNKGKTH